MNSRTRSEAAFTLVELLVVVLVMGVVAAAITSVTVSMLRNQTFQQQMAQAQDEARLVFERVRPEIRAARRVEAAAPDAVTFWVDRNFDGLQQPEELITYEVVELAGDPGRYEVLRYTDATGVAGAARIAGVLRNPDPFDAQPAAPDTQRITMDFTYDVDTSKGPQALDVATTVRLRNVA